MQSVKPLTLPLLAFILTALVGVFVATAPPAAAQGSVPPVTNIQLASGANSGEVVISWDAVPQATHYRIGYVNMEVDYHFAKASCTGEWIEAFIYVDVNARNIPVSNGRAEYTVRRLAQGARHALTVLTSNDFSDTGAGGSVSSTFAWPSNPRWRFLPGRDSLPPGITLPTPDCSAAVLPPEQQPLNPADMERHVRPALVQIETEDARGTGFIVRSDGTVVTNRHVVDGFDTVTAYMHPLDGSTQTFTGRVLGRAILPDLAVIRLQDNRTFSTLPLGDSDDLPSGTEVSVWGYPGARISRAPTRTNGIISSSGIQEDARYLQTDAAVNPGNSGGPLIDRYGNVVGVNTSKIVDEGVDNVGFAVASNEVNDRLNSLVSGGPPSATYRNLAFDYGYSMTIPKGWYLDREIAPITNFRPYAGRSVTYIERFTFKRPTNSSADLSLLADYIWEERLPLWAEDWVRFDKISKRKVTIAGQEFYQLEYRRQLPTSCVSYRVDLVSISSSYPGKPYGFITGNGTCEDTLSTYRAIRDTMLNSFRP